MAKSLQSRLEEMSKEDLEKLKEHIFSQMEEALKSTAYRSFESLNMKVRALGRNVMRVAGFLYSEGSEEYEACKKKAYNMCPTYRKKTEEEKMNTMAHMIANELEAERQYPSRIVRKLGYCHRVNYPKERD